jgi:hypothetical protein
MLISGVPLEVNNETCFKDPVDVGFFTWSQEVFGDPEYCSVELLDKHSDRFVARQRDGDALRIRRLNAASGGRLSVLPDAGRGLVGFHYLINPIRRCISVRLSFADPVTHQRPVVEGGWVLGNVVDDELFVLLVDWVETHPQHG